MKDGLNAHAQTDERNSHCTVMLHMWNLYSCSILHFTVKCTHGDTHKHFLFSGETTLLHLLLGLYLGQIQKKLGSLKYPEMYSFFFYT